MTNETKCPICDTAADYSPVSGDLHGWNCPRCGEFIDTGTAETLLREGKDLRPEILSGWVRTQNMDGVTPKIDSNRLERLKSLVMPPLKERVERYLAVAVSMCPTLGSEFNPIDPCLLAASYSANHRDAKIISLHLRDEGLLLGKSGKPWRVAPKGHIAYDDLRTRRTSSSQAFVAMWFNDKMKSAFENGFDPGIRAAGYDPFRFDSKEHANKIDDEIIAEIRRSAFLIVDFTGHRGGVYFEAGFAMGLGMPIIWTCQKDHINDLHFDIRQYNCIDWEKPEDLAERLKNRIEALLGNGPVSH